MLRATVPVHGRVVVLSSLLGLWLRPEALAQLSLAGDPLIADLASREQAGLQHVERLAPTAADVSRDSVGTPENVVCEGSVGFVEWHWDGSLPEPGRGLGSGAIELH
jgi:hypothetical protein